MREIYHYGTKRHSGRYPWGSGDRPHQHDSGRASVKKSQSKILQYRNGEIRTKSALRKCGSAFISDKDNNWKAMTVEMIDNKLQMYPPAQTIAWYEEHMDGVNPYPKNYKDNETLRFAGGNLSIKDLARSNPYFKKKDGYADNCTKCAATLEMRARGYDVSAGRSYEGVDSNCYSYWFDGANREVANTNDVNSILHDFGPGARGAIDFRNKGGGGHEIFWCIDDDGKLTYLDGQNGNGLTEKTLNAEYQGTDILTKMLMEQYGFDGSKPAGIVRLDNAKPNLEAMAEDSVFTDSFRSHGRDYTDAGIDAGDYKYKNGEIVDKNDIFPEDIEYDYDNPEYKKLFDKWYNSSDVEQLDSLASDTSEYYYNIGEDYLQPADKPYSSFNLKGIEKYNKALGLAGKKRGYK